MYKCYIIFIFVSLSAQKNVYGLFFDDGRFYFNFYIYESKLNGKINSQKKT